MLENVKRDSAQELDRFLGSVPRLSGEYLGGSFVINLKEKTIYH